MDETITVYYKTINNNLRDNKRPLLAQYYVEVPSGGDLTIDGKHYKIITPVANSVKECVVNPTDASVSYRDNPTFTVNSVEYSAADGHILQNGKTYKMEFRIDDLVSGYDINNRYHAVIYTRMRAQSSGTSDLTADQRDMNQTGTLDVLPASDSLSL